jgi:hypothetical protein
MKKNSWGFLAIALAISASILQSYSFLPKQEDQSDLTTYNWYPVDANNEISNTTAKYTAKTKGQAISVDPCKDDILPNCLYGTNGSVTLGQDISGEPAAQRIRKQN